MQTSNLWLATSNASPPFRDCLSPEGDLVACLIMLRVDFLSICGVRLLIARQFLPSNRGAVLLTNFRPLSSKTSRTDKRNFYSMSAWGRDLQCALFVLIYLSLPTSESTFSQPFKERNVSNAVRICSIIIFHLSKL